MSLPASASASNRDALLEAAAKYEIGKNLGGNLGPSIMGWAVDFMMFGLVLHQLITWLGGARQERTFIKVVTAFVVTVATATTVFSIWLFWFAFVTNFGKFYTFIRLDLVSWYGLLDVLVTLPVQMFYLERAYRLMHDKIWVPILILPFVLTSFAGGLASFIGGLRVDSVLDAPKLNVYFYLWFGATMAADLLLTGFIIYGLSKSRTGWSDTDRLVNRLIRTSVESQLPCTVIATATLVCYVVLNPNLFNAFWCIVHGKFYVVSYLAVLNYRNVLRHDADSSSRSSNAKPNTFGSSNRHQQETINLDQIKVDTETMQGSYHSPLPKAGLNRQRSDEEMTIDSQQGDRYQYGPETSRTHLTQS